MCLLHYVATLAQESIVVPDPQIRRDSQIVINDKLEKEDDQIIDKESIDEEATVEENKINYNILLFNEDIYTLLSKSSLFYSHDIIDKITSQIFLFEETSKSRKKGASGKTSRTKMIFFLNSILYRSESEWSVWVNGVKIDSMTKKSDLKVINIKDDSVLFEWTTGYTRFINLLSKLKAKGGLPEGINLGINNNTAIVRFTLSPIQSFVISNKVFINEGKSTKIL